MTPEQHLEERPGGGSSEPSPLQPSAEEKEQTPEPRFSLGQLVATPGALDALETTGEDALNFIARHLTGDWGDLDDEDKQENEFSVENDLRILSVYQLNDGTKIWIITEADRSVTTILLPSE